MKIPFFVPGVDKIDESAGWLTKAGTVLMSMQFYYKACFKMQRFCNFCISWVIYL